MKRIGILAICSAAVCMAAPTGFKVMAGNAKLKGNRREQTVSASMNSVVHWDDFSIGLGEKLKFQIPNSKVAVLNRVVGNKASVIHGAIESNGRVYLVNSKGVVIGTNARIQTADFLATTGKIADEQFLKGKDLEITRLADAGSIDQRGIIETKDGTIYLIAGQVKNSGKLVAPEGHVGIGVGQEVLIRPNGPEHIYIRPGKPISDQSGLLFAPPAPKKDIAIENTGSIDALVTEIKTHRHPYVEAIAHRGSIQATAVKRAKGRVYLTSENGSVLCSGKITAPGGIVQIDGQESTNICRQALIDVSHASSPGKILVGSRQSRAVHIDSSSTMHADNLKSGQGGEIVVLSSQSTLFEGTLTAEAKGKTGNGGKIEVSAVGSRGLQFKGTTSLKSKSGKDGLLFLDPQFAVIRAKGTDPAMDNTWSNASDRTVTISGADLSTALDSASVVIQANTDITFDDTVTGTASGNGLTLQAGRSVTFSTDSALTLNNGALNIKVNDEEALYYDRLPGSAGFFAFGPVTINTQGGDMTFNVGTYGGVQSGTMTVLKSNFDAGGGNIEVHGYRPVGNAQSVRTTIAESSQIVTSGTGTIEITGDTALDKQTSIHVSSGI